MEVFRACIEGYSDRLFDEQVLAIQTGYWAGYYNRARKPKPVKAVLESLMRKKTKQVASKSVKAPEVDVDAFLAQEQMFLQRLKK